MASFVQLLAAGTALKCCFNFYSGFKAVEKIVWMCPLNLILHFWDSYVSKRLFSDLQRVVMLTEMNTKQTYRESKETILIVCSWCAFLKTQRGTKILNRKEESISKKLSLKMSDNTISLSPKMIILGDNSIC